MKLVVSDGDQPKENRLWFISKSVKIDVLPDPRLRDYLFMSNPFPMFVILGCYLMFVLKWGPKFMKNRKPYDLNRIMIAYNIIQIIACARLVLQASVHRDRTLSMCTVADHSNSFSFRRDCSTCTNSTTDTVSCASPSTTAQIKCHFWLPMAVTHIFCWRWPIYWTLCFSCCARKRIKFRFCICIITPAWLCSHGMRRNFIPVATRCLRVSWTRSFTLSCTDITWCRRSILNTRITFGGRNT